MNKNNGAKFTFFYLLSLICLIFTSASVLIIAFELIDKFIQAPVGPVSGEFSGEAVKFAISSIFAAAPVFYVVNVMIQKGLYKGELESGSGIRRWLTYLILFISSVFIIGWMIGIMNSFLNGEITLKFIFKALASLILASAIFGFYFYDIRRTETVGKKDKTIKIFFYASMAAVVILFFAAFFIIESPASVNKRRIDEEIIRSFQGIDQCIHKYYKDNGELPPDLPTVREGCPFIVIHELKDPETGDMFGYNIKGEKKFELCADFRTSNKDKDHTRRYGISQMYEHDSGYQCLEGKINTEDDKPSL